MFLACIGAGVHFAHSYTLLDPPESTTAKSKPIGALSFAADDLRELLAKDQDCTGIVFKLKSKNSIEIEVLKAYQIGEDGNQTLVTKKLDRPFPFLVENPLVGSNSQENKPSDFHFEFHDYLIESNYSFSFCSRDELELILENNSDRLYLSGSVLDFGSIGKVTGKHFSLKLEIVEGKKLSKENKAKKGQVMPQDIGKPSFTISLPCPPHWPYNGE